MARNPFADLVGKIVALEAKSGPLKPCNYCASTSGQITEGTEMHRAGIRCVGCDRHIGWLSNTALTAMLAQKRGEAAAVPAPAPEGRGNAA